MRSRLNRRGATLPLTILVLAIMGGAVAVSYTRLSSERRISADSQAEIDAFTVAQSGYDSCALTRALAHVGSLQRLRNAGVDTWSSY